MTGKYYYLAGILLTRFPQTDVVDRPFLKIRRGN
jgi:hypothetical protein